MIANVQASRVPTLYNNPHFIATNTLSSPLALSCCACLTNLFLQCNSSQTICKLFIKIPLNNTLLNKIKQHQIITSNNFCDQYHFSCINYILALVLFKNILYSLAIQYGIINLRFYYGKFNLQCLCLHRV